jgi:hypothetical protein
MVEGGLRYYILFANYEQGLALHDLLTKADIKNRIAPAPRCIQGELSCGMSLLLEPEALETAKRCIEENHAEYHAIVPLEGQIRSHRDKYC